MWLLCAGRGGPRKLQNAIAIKCAARRQGTFNKKCIIDNNHVMESNVCGHWGDTCIWGQTVCFHMLLSGAQAQRCYIKQTHGLSIGVARCSQSLIQSITEYWNAHHTCWGSWIYVYTCVIQRLCVYIYIYEYTYIYIYIIYINIWTHHTCIHIYTETARTIKYICICCVCVMCRSRWPHIETSCDIVCDMASVLCKRYHNVRMHSFSIIRE